MTLRSFDGYAVAVHGYSGDVIGCGVLVSKSYMFRTESSNKSSGAISLNFFGVSLLIAIMMLFKFN